MNVYVACRAARHNDIDHGAWIKVGADVDFVESQIDEMLARSPAPNAEEYFIESAICQTSWSSFAGSLYIDEETTVQELVETAQFIEEHDDAAIAALALGETLDEARRLMRDYQGDWPSFTDFAVNEVQGMGLPDIAERYFDVEMYAKNELRFDYITHKLGDVVHVFRNV